MYGNMEAVGMTTNQERPRNNTKLSNDQEIAPSEAAGLLPESFLITRNIPAPPIVR